MNFGTWEPLPDLLGLRSNFEQYIGWQLKRNKCCCCCCFSCMCLILLNYFSPSYF